MKQVYDAIPLKPGNHRGGVFSVLVTPKEFVTVDPVIDFNTGIITTTLILIAGAAWYELQFAPQSYIYNEEPKTGREGDYFEITVKGTINNNQAYLQQVLNSIRYSELVAQVIDREKQIKLVGNASRAMKLQYNINNTTEDPSAKTIPVTLTFQTEESAPYYQV